MKKLYILAFSLLGGIAFAQNSINISFEASQGYSLGNIHGQNGWEITEGDNGIIGGQLVTNEQASQGTQAFKNSYLPEYDFMWLPVIGGAYNFSEPLSSTNASISFDVYVTEAMGSDFEIVFYHQDEIQEYYPVAGVGIGYQNDFYFIENENYYSQYSETASWQPNTWVNVRLEIGVDTISGYVDNQLAIELPRFSTNTIHGFNILHNNYGGDAYFDNIQIVYENLSTTLPEVAQNTIYPNPATDQIHVTTTNIEIESIEVYNLLGQQVASASKLSTLNIQDITPGTYIVKVKQTNGQSFQRKIVKK